MKIIRLLPEALENLKESWLVREAIVRFNITWKGFDKNLCLRLYHEEFIENEIYAQNPTVGTRAFPLTFPLNFDPRPQLLILAAWGAVKRRSDRYWQGNIFSERPERIGSLIFYKEGEERDIEIKEIPILAGIAESGDAFSVIELGDGNPAFNGIISDEEFNRFLRKKEVLGIKRITAEYEGHLMWPAAHIWLSPVKIPKEADKGEIILEPDEKGKESKNSKQKKRDIFKVTIAVAEIFAICDIRQDIPEIPRKRINDRKRLLDEITMRNLKELSNKLRDISNFDFSIIHKKPDDENALKSTIEGFSRYLLSQDLTGEQMESLIKYFSVLATLFHHIKKKRNIADIIDKEVVRPLIIRLLVHDFYKSKILGEVEIQNFHKMLEELVIKKNDEESPRLAKEIYRLVKKEIFSKDLSNRLKSELAKHFLWLAQSTYGEKPSQRISKVLFYFIAAKFFEISDKPNLALRFYDTASMEVHRDLIRKLIPKSRLT